MSVYIYGLKDETGIRYVGQTIDPAFRLKQHITTDLYGAKGLWIKGLLETGCMPELVILEVASDACATTREKWWVEHLVQRGADLTNWTWHRQRMQPKTTPLQLLRDTLQKLRMIAALSGESIVAVLERLASAELERLNKK